LRARLVLRPTFTVVDHETQVMAARGVSAAAPLLEKRPGARLVRGNTSARHEDQAEFRAALGEIRIRTLLL
jgi:hypothetical protein